MILDFLHNIETETSKSVIIALISSAAGQIRATVGQAQLLVVKRFKQFSSLVDDAEFGTGEKAIHSSDLQGFWEVIYFQVNRTDLIAD